MKVIFTSLRATVLVAFTTLVVSSVTWAQDQILDRDSRSYTISDTVLVESLIDSSMKYYFDEYQPDTSLLLAKNALQISQTIDYPWGQGTASYLIGLIFTSTSEYKNSILYLEKSTEISRQLNDSIQLSKALQASGRSYSILGQYQKALERYFESLELRMYLGDSSRLSWPLNNIGTVYFRQRNYDKALEYYQKTYEIEKKYSSPVEQASTLGNIGMIYQNMEDYGHALEYLKRSYEMLDSLGRRCRVIYSSLNLGSTYADLGNQEEAEKFYKITYEGGKECDNVEAVSNSLLGLGSIYLEQAQLGLAENSLKEAYDIAKEYELQANELDVSSKLYELYKLKREYKTAMEFLEIHSTLKDESFNEDLTEQITTLELNYQFEMERDSLEYQKQAELLTLNSELEKQKTFKYVIIAGLLVVMIVAFFIYRNYRFKKLANDSLEKKNRIQKEKLGMEERMRKQLEIENNQKARSLTSTSLQMLTLNEKLEEVIDNIHSNEGIDQSNRKKIIKELGKLKNADRQWDSIKMHFEHVHPNFFERLDQSYPQLSSNDQKILAFLKMKLSNKEMALILNVTRRAIEQSKRRLKKKLGMVSEDMDILGFIEQTSDSEL